MHTLVVGWHDEFNSLEGWSPWTAFGGADILGGMDGTLRVTLGSTSMFMQEFGHYRAGVWKEVDVDLHRYPILAVRVLHFRNGSSWDVGVLEYRDKNARMLATSRMVGGCRFRVTRKVSRQTKLPPPMGGIMPKPSL
jgi:hypothetical protein